MNNLTGQLARVVRQECDVHVLDYRKEGINLSNHMLTNPSLEENSFCPLKRYILNSDVTGVSMIDAWIEPDDCICDECNQRQLGELDWDWIEEEQEAAVYDYDEVLDRAWDSIERRSA